MKYLYQYNFYKKYSHLQAADMQKNTGKILALALK